MDPDPDPLVRGADPDPDKNVTDPQHWFAALRRRQKARCVCWLKRTCPLPRSSSSMSTSWTCTRHRRRSPWTGSSPVGSGSSPSPARNTRQPTTAVAAQPPAAPLSTKVIMELRFKIRESIFLLLSARSQNLANENFWGGLGIWNIFGIAQDFLNTAMSFL